MKNLVLIMGLLLFSGSLFAQSDYYKKFTIDKNSVVLNTAHPVDELTTFKYPNNTYGHLDYSIKSTHDKDVVLMTTIKVFDLNGNVSFTGRSTKEIKANQTVRFYRHDFLAPNPVSMRKVHLSIGYEDAPENTLQSFIFYIDVQPKLSNSELSLNFCSYDAKVIGPESIVPASGGLLNLMCRVTLKEMPSNVDLYLKLYLDNQLLKTQKFTNVTYNSAEINAAVNLPHGLHVIKLEIDPDNYIHEHNEWDSVHKMQVFGDLNLANWNFLGAGILEVDGVKSTSYSDIFNIKVKDTNVPYKLVVYFKHTSPFIRDIPYALALGSDIILKGTFNNVASGPNPYDSTQLNVFKRELDVLLPRGLQVGKKNFALILDPDKTIRETNEIDNYSIFQFNFSLPDYNLKIGSAKVNDVEVVPMGTIRTQIGQKLKIDLPVSVSGEFQAKYVNMKLLVQVDSRRWLPLATLTQWIQTSWGSKTITFEGATNLRANGEYPAKIVIDPDDTITEKDESDNEIAFKLKVGR